MNTPYYICEDEEMFYDAMDRTPAISQSFRSCSAACVKTLPLQRANSTTELNSSTQDRAQVISLYARNKSDQVSSSTKDLFDLHVTSNLKEAPAPTLFERDPSSSLCTRSKSLPDISGKGAFIPLALQGESITATTANDHLVWDEFYIDSKSSTVTSQIDPLAESPEKKIITIPKVSLSGTVTSKSKEKIQKISNGHSLSKEQLSSCCPCCGRNNFGTNSQYITCPNCRRPVCPDSSYVTSNRTHFFACLLTPVGLCCIPYCSKYCKRVQHNCPLCRVYIATSS